MTRPIGPQYTDHSIPTTYIAMMGTCGFAAPLKEQQAYKPGLLITNHGII